MFFDLVESEKYSVSDLPSKLPMGLSKSNLGKTGAVSATRFLLDLLVKGKYLTKGKKYDFGNPNEWKGIELAARDTAIFFDWISMKNIFDPESYIECYDYDQKIENLNISQVGSRIHSYFSIVEKYPANLKWRKTAIDFLEAANNYVASAICEDSQNIFSKKAIVFNALYSLIIEWYDIDLNYLNE